MRTVILSILLTILAAMPRTIVVDNDVLTADVSIDEAVFSFTPELAQDIVADAQARIDAMLEDARFQILHDRKLSSN